MRRRRVTLVGVLLLGGLIWLLIHQPSTGVQQPSMPNEPAVTAPQPQPVSTTSQHALVALDTLPVKGKAAKTGYARTQFGNGWASSGGCDTRNAILQRDLTSVVLSDDCKVMSGVLNDPYTGAVIQFARGVDTSALVQIDHVVALSNAWQTGAQQLTPEQRIALANDPLELLAVDGAANQQKSDGDAATWLPANKPFRCQYVARQIAVKIKYALYVVPAEKQAMQRVLQACPSQTLP